MQKHKLSFEERDINEIDEAAKKPVEGLYNRIEIENSVLVNVSGETVEKYLSEKGIIAQLDKDSDKSFYVDEEQEALRSKTTRFF